MALDFADLAILLEEDGEPFVELEDLLEVVLTLVVEKLISLWRSLELNVTFFSVTVSSNSSFLPTASDRSVLRLRYFLLVLAAENAQLLDFLLVVKQVSIFRAGEALAPSSSYRICDI